MMSNKHTWDKEELERLYWQEQKSTPEIAQIVGCCDAAVRQTMRKLSIPIRSYSEAMLLRGQKQSIWASFSKEVLDKLYWGQEKSTEDIAKIYNCNETTVSRAMKNLGIPLRSIKERKIASLIQHPIKKGPDSPCWIGGRKTKEGYVLVYKPEHPYAHADGYIFEHRLVMEKELGRYLLPSETVHHKGIRYDDIRNRSDNLIDNLELRIGQHGKGIALMCADCELRKEVRLLRQEIKELREQIQYKMEFEITPKISVN